MPARQHSRLDPAPGAAVPGPGCAQPHPARLGLPTRHPRPTPQARRLADLVYRDQLFPRDAYRRTWDRLVANQPARAACRVMLGLLALVHERGCEADLAGELNRLIEADAMPDLGVLEARFAPSPGRMPDVTVTLPSPDLYDALLLPDAVPEPHVAGALS